MLAILKLLRSLIKTLHSDGAPWQIAAGVALGAALGLTPIANVHNLVVVLLMMVLNVSFASGMLAWAVFVPVGFLLDPLFDRVGHWLLLDVAALRPLWTAMENIPGLGLTSFNNTVVLGSVVVWLVLFLPIYFATRLGVLKYRASIGQRMMQSKFYKTLQGTKIFSVYTYFSS